MTSPQKTTVAVLGIGALTVMGCCGLTLALGAFAAIDEQRAAAGSTTLGGPVALVRALDGGAPPGDDEAASRATFAHALLAELVDAGQGGFEWNPGDDSLERDGGVLALGNLHAEWAALDPEAQPDFVRRAARGAFPPELPATWEAARPHVLVTVRDRLFVELLRLRGADGVLHRPLGDGLVEVLVYDTPDSMQYLQPEQAQRWGVDAERLFKAGRSELLARSRGDGFEAIAPGLYASPWKDNHDIGRAALPALLRGLKLTGEPVVFLPHRDHLLVAGSEDPAALAAAAARVEALLDGPRSLSGRAWRLGKAGLEPFEPAGDAPHALALQRLRRTSALRDANEQKDALDAKHQAEGIDVFVGTALLLEDEAGEEVSYCVWTKGVDTLLPRAEYVVFVDVDVEGEGEGRIVAAARWEDVERQVKGALARDDSTWPPRYRARDFPAPGVIAALGLDPRFAPPAE
jgi:hypothetical protein